MRTLKLIVLPLLLAALPTPVAAAAVIGGDTRVAFTDAISGLQPGLTGTASLIGAAPLTLNFPVTGGALDAGLAGSIRHDGSGLTLSNGANTIGLGNFVIDTVTSTLFGDATLNDAALGTALPLFTFDLGTVSVAELTDLANPALALLITSTTSGALTTAFGLGDTTGVTVGFAATAPSVAAIPEPGTWMLMIGGFGLTGIAVRRRERGRTVAA